MSLINETIVKYDNGVIDKPSFIKAMFEEHHASLFDYSTYLQKTNIASIEITDDAVVMTSRDKGVKMICPPGDHRVASIEALNFHDYETIDSAMIMKLVSPNDCVVDIGANMGWYSINIAKTFPTCKVHAFEPLPQTYAYLEKNIKLNLTENIFPHHFGLSSERKDLTFYFYPEGSGNASSANLSERKDAELVTCHVEKLDDFVIANKLHVDFIKCDVEGTELFAFQGAVETLKLDKPIVFTEMLRKWAKKFDYHPNEIIELFTAIGYRCFVAHEDRLKEFFVMDEETVETNFFFLHSEKHQPLILSLSSWTNSSRPS
jgi:FkbM family methyltransferase